MFELWVLFLENGDMRSAQHIIPHHYRSDPDGNPARYATKHECAQANGKLILGGPYHIKGDLYATYVCLPVEDEKVS